jgi:hypothetical protein
MLSTHNSLLANFDLNSGKGHTTLVLEKMVNLNDELIHLRAGDQVDLASFENVVLSATRAIVGQLPENRRGGDEVAELFTYLVSTVLATNPVLRKLLLDRVLYTRVTDFVSTLHGEEAFYCMQFMTAMKYVSEQRAEVILEDYMHGKLNIEELGYSEAQSVVELCIKKRNETFEKEAGRRESTNRSPAAQDSMAAAAVNVLEEADMVMQRANASEYAAEMKQALLSTAALISEPTNKRVAEYKHEARALHVRPGLKAFAGAMLMLAGVALLALSIAAIVFTFGAATPVAALGFMVGVSAVSLGVTAAFATAGVAGAVSGGILLFGKQPLQKKMCNLAEAAQNNLQQDEPMSLKDFKIKLKL